MAGAVRQAGGRGDLRQFPCDLRAMLVSTRALGLLSFSTCLPARPGVRQRHVWIKLTREEQSVALGTLDGIWKSTDAEQRFRLNVSGAVFKLTERNSAGTELVRDARVQFDDDGTVKISRLNDDEVLNFLGFQPSLRAEIAARSPSPSFIWFSLADGGLHADWYGLLVTKDEKAHLKELVQPGTRPPKAFTFQR